MATVDLLSAPVLRLDPPTVRDITRLCGGLTVESPEPELDWAAYMLYPPN